MGDTTISWTDMVWNPTRGCRRISPGCGGANGEGGCYAERMADRIVRMGRGNPTPYDGLVKMTGNGPRWTGAVAFDPEKLAEPLRWRKPRRVFVDSMSDLFYEGFSNEQIAAVYGVMAACPQHTFQCLTKRSVRMRAVLCDPEFPFFVAKARDAALVDRDHDPYERWHDIPGFNGYKASSNGRIRNADGVDIKQHFNERVGRYTVSIYNDGHQTTQFAHRLVLLAFGGKPSENQEACHRNGIKIDNRSANLRWGTRSENQREKVDHGSRGGPAKLDIHQAELIRQARRSGETQQAIADRFGVSRSLVSMIESGRVWSGPDLPWPIPNVWLGVSVENQDAADERIPELLATPAAVRFLSCEPLLDELDLLPWFDPTGACCGGFDGCSIAGTSACPASASWRHTGPVDPSISWVIAGCESGPGARPCDVAWLRSLRDQCAAAGVAFFLKQACEGEGITFGLGSRRKPGGVIELPYLDGVQHAAFPADPGQNGDRR